MPTCRNPPNTSWPKQDRTDYYGETKQRSNLAQLQLVIATCWALGRNSEPNPNQQLHVALESSQIGTCTFRWPTFGKKNAPLAYRHKTISRCNTCHALQNTPKYHARVQAPNRHPPTSPNAQLPSLKNRSAAPGNACEC